MAKREPYEKPASFARILEAGIAAADADSDDDTAFHAAEMRLRQAVAAHAPRVLGAKGGRARAAKLSPEARSESARQAAKARWSRRVRSGTQAGET